jgi:hypothetical protein
MAVIFWQGNDGTKNAWPLTTESAQSWNLTKGGSPVPNDEARSCTIVDASAGTVIRVYDSPSGSESDDWAEIRVNENVSSPVVVNTFEATATYGGGTVSVTFHKHNGLDGKVSFISITPG